MLIVQGRVKQIAPQAYSSVFGLHTTTSTGWFYYPILIPTIKKTDPPSRHHTDGGRIGVMRLPLELSKDRNNRTGYAVDVAITRIGPGHQQPTKTAFRIAQQGHQPLHFP